ncbi:unnamed protein product [Vitrella brassicaformis CCMP3155]|uniref:ATP-dependent RNA helicase n=2 Tax=Vitrella brassicaformis TaxID=1169539 RepID=A0A0G4EX39_VITBC|nr:unnamed protein product [Vitrella brassicaformis CCMP3155]|eukprot:CEM03562.1 unnamed protein product [Vitrella brassicaformis CCMP3155]
MLRSAAVARRSLPSLIVKPPAFSRCQRARTSTAPTLSAPPAPQPSAYQPVVDLKLSDELQRGLHDVMGIARLTAVQQMTFRPASEWSDVLIRAPSGSGKTVAFLLPVLHKLHSVLASGSNSTSGISCLIISPTRELAMQTHSTCERLLQYHRSMTCGLMVSGGPIDDDLRRIREDRPTVLIVTPGRLVDHMKRTDHFLPALKRSLRVLIVDEAAHLLDLPCIKALLAIINRLPEDRQTLLFTSTVDEGVRRMAQRMLRTNFEYLDCTAVLRNHDIMWMEQRQRGDVIDDTAAGDVPELAPSVTRLSSHVPVETIPTPTNPSLSQHFLHYPSERFFLVLYNLIERERQAAPETYKLVVFFPTVRFLQFAYVLLKHLVYRGQPDVGMMALHRHLTVARRRAAWDRFAGASRGVLFASDLAGMGLDLPNVTLVVQIGHPPTADQYINRVGRTARMGDSGRALLLLNELESHSLTPLLRAHVPIRPAPSSLKESLLLPSPLLDRLFAPSPIDFQPNLSQDRTPMLQIGGSPSVLPALVSDDRLLTSGDAGVDGHGEHQGQVADCVRGDHRHWYSVPHLYASGALAYRSLVGYYAKMWDTLRIESKSVPAVINKVFESAGLRKPPVVTKQFAATNQLIDAPGLHYDYHATRKTALIAALPGYAGHASRLRQVTHRQRAAMNNGV